MSRKDEHIRLAQQGKKIYQENDFDKVRFVHHGFCETSVNDVDLSTTLFDKKLSTFFYINAMTGGSEWTKQINEQLSEVASRCELAMATGSLSAALKDEGLQESFQVVRKNLPNGLVFANLQASATVEQAKKTVAIVNADALQLHINHPQELIMPEGDRDFTGWEENIQNLVSALNVPIMIKEVGFGMSQETIQKCIELGVQAVDISGRGGTNFAYIENQRREYSLDYMNDWGQSTVLSLIESSDSLAKIQIVASGGIRHPLDIIKALSLGASAVGISGTILHKLMDEGVEATVKMIESWKSECRIIMTALGAKNRTDLLSCDLLFDASLISLAKQRSVDIDHFNHRSNFKRFSCTDS